jgi:hypothetical protein
LDVRALGTIGALASIPAAAPAAPPASAPTAARAGGPAVASLSLWAEPLPREGIPARAGAMHLGGGARVPPERFLGGSSRAPGSRIVPNGKDSWVGVEASLDAKSNLGLGNCQRMAR